MCNLLGEEWHDFSNALTNNPPTSIRYNRAKAIDRIAEDKVSWCDNGIYLTERPVFTLDPLLHAGTYYVQEASSMFIEQIAGLWKDLSDLHFLDLCAAPGGKSTHLADLLPKNSLLVSNEVIRNRASILAENITKWGNPNVLVTNNDPKNFAELYAYFDVVLVDAPCSGEGMFRKDPSSIKAWKEENIKLCAERQRRIVADVWGSLKNDGLLIYSTCTYTREENEENIKWIMQSLGADRIQLPIDPFWNISINEYGYRFFPHKIKGEGFFISILQKKSGKQEHHRRKAPKNIKIDKAKQAPNWLSGDFIFTQQGPFLKALPTTSINDIVLLKQHLHILSAGIEIGEIKGHDIIPNTALALSTALQEEAFQREAVDRETALRFLHRDTIQLSGTEKGFYLLCYQNKPLGFVKNIGNRINNLYPSNWRIRMDIL